jgi:hypothetical protein
MTWKDAGISKRAFSRRKSLVEVFTLRVAHLGDHGAGVGISEWSDAATGDPPAVKQKWSTVHKRATSWGNSVISTRGADATERGR